MIVLLLLACRRQQEEILSLTGGAQMEHVGARTGENHSADGWTALWQAGQLNTVSYPFCEWEWGNVSAAVHMRGHEHLLQDVLAFLWLMFPLYVWMFGLILQGELRPSHALLMMPVDG